MTHLMDTVRFRKLGIEYGQGACLVSADDKTYIDFFADVGTASLGYRSDEMLKAIARVADSGIVHSPILFENNRREHAAEQLCKLTKMDKVFFCNSGAEAVEAAIKIARKRWWQKYHPTHINEPFFTGPEIWCQRGSFHGRTLAGVAAGDGPPYHRAGFGPLPHGFRHFDNWRDIPEVDEVAAVMVSPVFGNNDVRPFQGDTWVAGAANLGLLRVWCNQRDIPLIFDEVQSGAGRCGGVTYADVLGSDPADIITLGKGIAMGAPVGAVLARGEYATVLTPGSHFSTFGGNPLCCEFLIGMLRWLQADGNLGRADAVGKTITDALDGHPHVKAIRRQGALVAVDIDADVLALAQRCEDHGLLLGAFRHGPGPLKITPPLNIDSMALRQGLRVLCEQLAAA